MKPGLFLICLLLTADLPSTEGGAKAKCKNPKVLKGCVGNLSFSQSNVRDQIFCLHLIEDCESI